ncbi:hypothetical protein BBD46_03965 [Natrialba sp. SSL1]|nr:hypothetical protein BBD46_03965 [Natrialba sp. SSL1]
MCQNLVGVTINPAGSTRFGRCFGDLTEKPLWVADQRFLSADTGFDSCVINGLVPVSVGLAFVPIQLDAVLRFIGGSW